MKVPKRYRFACPGCGNVFWRRAKDPQRGTTRCLECNQKFLRKDGVLSLAESVSTALRKTRKGVKRTIHQEHNIVRMAEILPKTVRGDQIPNSDAECSFKSRCFDKGWSPHRLSWPDFLVETSAGELFAVEVKSKSDVVRPEQKISFDLLERAGIPVFIWKNTQAECGVLRRWKKSKELPIEILTP